MNYIKTTTKSVEQAVADLHTAVADNKFGVLHVHNIKQTLNNKGFDFEAECHVFEVCNPLKAQQVLNIDMSLNMALPCRISVYQEDGQTKIGMINPTSILAALSDSQELAKIAEEVEDISKTIIDQAAG